MNIPDISIVLITYNNYPFTYECISSIIRHTFDITYEIIVVDNASTDGTPEFIKQDFEQVKVIVNPINKGYGAACNQGMREASGRYIAILNNDTKLLDNAFKILLQFLDSHPNVGVAAPKLLNPDRSLQPSVHLFPSVWALFIRLLIPVQLITKPIILNALNLIAGKLKVDLGRYRKIEGTREVLSPMGAAFVVRSKILDSIGGFDDEIFMFAEEGEWFYRIHKGGWKIFYVAEANIIHIGGQSIKTVKHRYFIQQYMSYLHFFHKHSSPFIVFLYKTTLSIVFLLKAFYCWSLSFIPIIDKKKYLQFYECYITIPQLFFNQERRKQNVMIDMEFRYIDPPNA
jgi:GT2 family glycosyltransferase